MPGGSFPFSYEIWFADLFSVYDIYIFSIYIPDNRDIVIFHVLYLKEIPLLKTSGEKNWLFSKS